jgi:hypothetical protein
MAKKLSAAEKYARRMKKQAKHRAELARQREVLFQKFDFLSVNSEQVTFKDTSCQAKWHREEDERLEAEAFRRHLLRLRFEN